MRNPAFHSSQPLEDCATPLWVGPSRWLLVDLAARRGDWGPALGGDGVVTFNSLPDVAYVFGAAGHQLAGAFECCFGSMVWLQGLGLGP